MSKKRLMSLILTAVMVLSVFTALPFTAEAVGIDAPAGIHTAPVGLNKGDKLGDADRDGDVTVMDATRIQRFLAELCDIDGKDFSGAALTEDQLLISDADEDGDVSVMDATAIQRFMADLPTHEGIGEDIYHEWIEATCTEPKTCRLCGKTIGEPLGHDPGPARTENVKQPTCTVDGRHDEVVCCTRCSAELSRSTVTDPATGHHVVNGVCTVCGQKIVAVLYEDSNVKITFRNAERYKYDNTRLEMYFYLQNKTSKTLLIQADAVSLNGYCFKDLIMSDNVAAYSTGLINLSVQRFAFDLIDFNNISTIGGQFRIINDNNWRDMYDAIFTNVKLDASGQGGPRNNNLLYEDDSVAIYYYSAEKYRFDDNRLELYLQIYNKTYKTLLIQADAISINGFGYSDLIMSDEVLAQTVGFVDVSVKGYDFGLTPINSISTVGGQLRIIDDHNWSNIYKATFYNVSVTR